MTDDKFADEVIVRGSVENQKMARIFIKKMNGLTRIVGATVINDPAEVAPLTVSVRNKIDVAKYKKQLGDQSFDFKQLLAT